MKTVICNKHDSTPDKDCFWCDPISIYRSINRKIYQSESDNLTMVVLLKDENEENS